jgi:hypothetical protein
MGEHGSPSTRVRLTVATGNPTLVTAAALELGRLSLADALAVCLVFCDHDRARFERAAVRWLGRFCYETPGLTLGDAQLAVVLLPSGAWARRARGGAHPGRK